MPKIPEHPGLFNWHRKYAVQVGLPFALVLAALMHAPFFLFFDVKYPPPSGFRPSNTRVVFVDGRTTAGERFLAWLEADDPALFSAAFQDSREEYRPSPRAYRASFDMRTIDLESAPARPLPTPPETVASMAPVFAHLPLRVPDRQLELPPTRISYGGDLAGAGPEELAGLRLPTDLRVTPRPIVLEVGVASDGQVRYLFSIASSGVSALDARVDELLRKAKFEEQAGADLRWGQATVYWGLDPEPENAP